MDDLFNNPVKYLLILLFLLAFLLMLFKILNWLESLASKKKAKKETTSDNAKTEDVKGSQEKDKESFDINSNYLYDRFVVSPCKEDNLNVDLRPSQAYLTEEEFEDIRNSKVNIEVKPVENNSNNLANKLDSMVNENKGEKEKLLEEFNTLSREMKLLLIENILKKKDKQ